MVMILRLLSSGSPLPWFLVLLAAACAHDPRVEEFESDIGRLTQDELIRQYGYPQRLKKLATGNEAWDYEFLSGQSRCVGYRVYFDEDRHSTSWEPQPCRFNP